MSRTTEDKSEISNARNAAAMRRLEELLRDPGPGITVRRVEASDQFARVAMEPKVTPVVAPVKPTPAVAAPVVAAPVEPAPAVPAPAIFAPVVPLAAKVIEPEALAPKAPTPASPVPAVTALTVPVPVVPAVVSVADPKVPASTAPLAQAAPSQQVPRSAAFERVPRVVPPDRVARANIVSAPAPAPEIAPVSDKAPDPAPTPNTIPVASKETAHVIAAEPVTQPANSLPVPEVKPVAQAGAAPKLTVSAVQAAPIAQADVVPAVENAAVVAPVQSAPQLSITATQVPAVATVTQPDTPAPEIVPVVSSHDRLRERLLRPALEQPPAAEAPVAALAATPPEPAKPTIGVTTSVMVPEPAPVPAAPPAQFAATPAASSAPESARAAPVRSASVRNEHSAIKAQPPVAAKDPAVRPATADHLKHMPAGVRGKLASFLDGKAAPPVTPAPAAATVPSTGISSPAMGKAGDGELWTALQASRKPFMAAGLFSFVINILMLAGPLFMLQVYDRVLGSGSLATLVALTILTSAMYGIIGMLELARTRIIVRMGTEIDQRVSDRIFRASLRKTLSNPSASIPALRELDNVRQFAGSQGPLTFFDAPWTPIYLGVIGMVHWALGLTAVIGALSLMAITWASEKRSRGPLSEASKAMGRSIELAETGQRNAESLTAMGMVGAYRDRWQEANWDSLSWQMRAADRLGSMSAFSKGLRLFLQSLMLAIGAALAVKGEISAGSIIAGTIIFGRALAPIEQAIGHWKGYLKARESYAKLDKLLRSEPEPPQRTALPTPRGRLEVESLRVAAPDTRNLILTSVNFYVEPGQMLAVIGPSASGKSTLARTLVGLWQPVGGSIRLDGARLEQWDPEALGAHIGFLPQNVELFAGSVRDNIARFQRDATDDEVTEAARAAHAHELIMALPEGYETQLGAFGTYLSSGQRQRIALSRALFRHPALVVLDEPNSNLDRDGDEALAAAIDGMRERGQAVILVSHRVQAIGKADLLLYLERGAQRAFGPRREVMKLFQPGSDAPAVPPAALPKNGRA